MPDELLVGTVAPIALIAANALFWDAVVLAVGVLDEPPDEVPGIGGRELFWLLLYSVISAWLTAEYKRDPGKSVRGVTSIGSLEARISTPVSLTGAFGPKSVASGGDGTIATSRPLTMTS